MRTSKCCLPLAPAGGGILRCSLPQGSWGPDSLPSLEAAPAWSRFRTML